MVFNANAQQRGPEKWSASVYPNPSNGVITVQLAGKYDELTHINVVNDQGKSVFWKNIENDRKHEFDLTHLSPGKYMINMMSTNVYMKQPLIIF